MALGHFVFGAFFGFGLLDLLAGAADDPLPPDDDCLPLDDDCWPLVPPAP